MISLSGRASWVPSSFSPIGNAALGRRYLYGNNQSSCYTAYGFKLMVLTNSVLFLVISLFGLVFILKVFLSCVPLKRGLYVPWLMLSIPQVCWANKTLYLNTFTWRKILLGKYSIKSPFHQNAYKDVWPFVVFPPLPKEMIHWPPWIVLGLDT